MHDSIIIPDTSCLIYLDKIEQLELFQKLYHQVLVSRDVAEEYIEPLPDWITVQEIKEKRYQAILEQTVDKGEASIMMLAMETDNAIVCIDDKEGRKIAHKLGLRLTGTLGIIYKAKQEDLISSTREVIERLKELDFRISKKVENEILRLSGE